MIEKEWLLNEKYRKLRTPKTNNDHKWMTPEKKNDQIF